jgi:hypothetical protein
MKANDTIIDRLIACRNEIQLLAESIDCGDECWVRLGIANRHLERLVSGTMELSRGVEDDVSRCFLSTQEWLNTQGIVAARPPATHAGPPAPPAL